MLKAVACAAVVVAVLIGLSDRPEGRQQERNSGVSTVCGTFSIDLNLFFGSITLAEPNDEGWAYVDPGRKIRAATGVAQGLRVASIDSFSNHDSHDLDFELELDPGQEDLLSIQDTDAIGVEWETGIRPSEKNGDGTNPTFPKWVWPSDGDRVWAEGNWIFDCGHPEEDTRLYKTEIHPPRAVASMREQAGPLPGTGVTPVPITMTDLYISGMGGFTPNQLNCGPHITLGDYGSTCGQWPAPADDSYKTTPIDADFTFDVCLPPRSQGAVFSSSVAVGPRNTVGIEPMIDPVPAAGACKSTDGFDHDTMMRVTVKLKNTATPPSAVYARHIAAGWVLPPAEPLRHRRVTVNSTNLFEDHDLDPGDGELTFWWVNVNRAAPGWLRLSDFADGNMDDYDDETAFGDGEMSFTNASVDFYLRDGQGFAVHSRGFEQDCYDNIGAFGSHRFNLLVYIGCNADVSSFSDHGAGDEIGKADGEYDGEFFGPGTIHGGGDYDMRLTVDHLPLAFEDTSYLSLGLSCAPSGEVALVGQPFACSTRVDNAGPGLPRNVTVRTRFDAGPPTAAAIAAAWEVSHQPFGSGAHACAVAGGQSLCEQVVVPVVARAPAVVSTTGTPTAPGVLAVHGDVTTSSTDPELNNNSASTTIEVFQPVTVDIAPGDGSNVVNLTRGGTVSVAILTTGTFDATTVDPASVCFGDAGTPGERTCAERHGRGHFEDVNKDKKPDLLLHFVVADTGIDLGDTTACLIARTTQGVGVYGCDGVAPR